MPDTVLAVTLLWMFVFVYAIAASMDFGAGFWSMLYINQEKTKATRIANRYLSPSWEVTNVFVVAIVIALVGFFPGATTTLGTVLLIPGSIAILLLLLRSAFMVFSHLVKPYERLMSVVSGVTGMIIPALLISVLPITEGGFIDIENGVEQLQILRLLSSPHEYAYIGLALSSTLFLSSILLADYSRSSGAEEAYAVYRRDGIVLGPITLLMAFLTLVTMQQEAAWLYQNLLGYVPWLVASGISFLLAYIALSKGYPRAAVVGSVVQYLLASYAYGAAHLPYMIYPHVTIESGFTHPSTFRAIFWVYVVGMAILAPGFLYFWKMFMNDHTLKQHQIK